MENKEKNISLSLSQLTEWGVILAMILSGFIANKYGEMENRRRIEVLEKENIELRKVSEKVAEVNGKQDIIIKYVEAINHRLDANK
jgi:hypothetical protein